MNKKSVKRTAESLHQCSRMASYALIMGAVTLIISIDEWFGRELNFFIYIILFVYMAALVRWLIAIRHTDGLKKMIVPGDYSEEAAKSGFKYGWFAIVLFFGLLIVLEIFFKFDFPTSVIIRLTLAISMVVPAITYLVLTREKEESDGN